MDAQVQARMDELICVMINKVPRSTRTLWHSHLLELLSDTPFRIVGAGNFAQVFSHKATPDVVYKVILRTDDAYETYVNACMESNFKYEWMPKIYAKKTVPYGAGCSTVTIVAMEKLQTIEDTEGEWYDDADTLLNFMKIGMPTYLSHRMSTQIKQPPPRENYRKCWRRHCRMLRDKSMWLHQWVDLYQQKSHPEMRLMMRQARKFIFLHVAPKTIREGVYTDLGIPNVMLRGKTIVLTDPVC